MNRHTILICLAIFWVLFVLLRIRPSICTTGGKWVFGINLQIDDCGCKHFDIVCGKFYLRLDFGTCANRPKK